MELTLQSEHFDARTFVLDAGDVASLGDNSIHLLLLRLYLRKLLVETLELRLRLRDVRSEGFDLIAVVCPPSATSVFSWSPVVARTSAPRSKP